jgi:hypothetical protein
MRWLVAFSVVAIAGAGWASWHSMQFRSCGARTCAPESDDPTLRLRGGREVRVLGTRQDEGRRLVIDYLTELDRADLRGLCAEAEEVWEAALTELDVRRLERAVLGATSPKSEFLGMKYGVVPLYTCCVSTYLRVEKDRSGAWTFPECDR